MDQNFSGKRVLITGAGQGIGRALAKCLAQRGAHVVALSKTSANLESLKRESPSVETVCVDLADWESTKAAVENVGHVDMLVNNAAVAILQPVGEITSDVIDRSFAVNVKAAINVSQIISRRMKEKGHGGSIVNISSQAGLVALENHAVYCATKAALDSLTKVMALELGPHQIRVNSVNPTVVMTEMAKVGWSDPAKASALKAKIPLGKFCVISESLNSYLISEVGADEMSAFKGWICLTPPPDWCRPATSHDIPHKIDPDDVVNVVMFLLSDKSSMVTGTLLPIDGGYTAC